MKVKKSILGLVLVSALSTGLVGCGNTTSESDNVGTQNNETKNEVTKVEKAENIVVEDGSQIEAGGLSLTFNKGEFAYEIKPEKPVEGLLYNYYKGDPGKVYYQIYLDLKNNNTEGILLSDVITCELVYNTDYKYEGFRALEAADKSMFDSAGSTLIDPLETRSVRLAFDVPEEVEKTEHPVYINIYIDGQTYTYKVR